MRPGITSIILAAGANTRLGGLVAPFMKPLILVNGRPLIHHALAHAAEWNTVRDVIVCGPNNASLLVNVVPGISSMPETQWALQPQPVGVNDAICRALPYVETEHVLILCGDNTFSTPPIAIKGSAYIGARKLDWPDAKRFTRFRQREKGLELIAADHADRGDGCWIGPLLLRTEEVRKHVRLAFTISQLIEASTDGGRELQPLWMECADMGIPDSFTS